jgi:hypothetical protein
VNAVPLYWRVHQKIGLSHAEFFRALLPAVNGAFFMCLAVVASKLLLDGHLVPVVWHLVQACPWELPYLPKIELMLQWLLDGHFGHGIRLIVQIACGAVAYILALWIFHSERLLAFRRSLAAVST